MSKAPTRLPPSKKKVKVGKDQPDREPVGLPPAVKGKSSSQLVVDNNRICKWCGEEGRIYSNSTGKHVTCNRCKKTWPISTTPVGSTLPINKPRGLRKETLVEPDWDKAFD